MKTHDKFNNIVIKALEHKRIRCCLISGWWGAGKTYAISMIKKEIGAQVISYDAAEIGRQGSLSDENNTKFNGLETSFILKSIREQKQKRFKNPEELVQYYRLLEKANQRNLLNLIWIMGRNKTRTLLVEVPPLFLLWWNFHHYAYWIRSNKRVRLNRLSAGYPEYGNDVAVKMELQYRAYSLESGDPLRLIKIDSSAMLLNDVRKLIKEPL